MRRSSSRSGPVSPLGRCGSIRAHCLSFSQNKPARILSPPNQHVGKRITWRYLGTDPSARKRSSAQMAIDEGAPPVFDGTDQMVDRRRLSYEELPASCPLMARNPTRPHDYQATAGTALFNSARSTASGRCSTTWNGWATSISGELRPPVTGVEEGHSGSGGPDSFVEFVTTHVLRYTILPLSLLFPSRQPPIMPFVALAAQLFANKSSTSLLGSPPPGFAAC
jgi:hypothetical protein